MTPEPPASSGDNPLPPRHRPTLGNLSQDTTETDLWALDDDLLLPEDEAPAAKAEPRPMNREIPSPRERQPGRPDDKEPHASAKPAAGEESVRMNVTRLQPPSRVPEGPAPGPAKPESDFDDLENWEDVNLEPELGELPVEVLPVPELSAPMPAAEAAGKPAAAPAVESPAREEAPVPEAPSDDEFSPAPRRNAEPISLRPRLGLTMAERVGLIVLVVLLLGGGATFFISSLKRLPVESVKAESNDFPIKGKFLSVSSATSYWRPPVTEGPDADTFRRGTVLLPVLELKASGGPAAIRVLFRGDDGTVVGDAVTRTINGDESLAIPATAGFDDPGMHAAYRTGESKPWTIEVYEARSPDAAGKDFEKLFEMNISTDRR